MTDLPTRKLTIHNHHFDSEKWDAFELREGDIIVTTAYKTGTTWTQNILITLMFQGQTLPPEAANMTPWMDLRVPPIQVQLPGILAQEGKRQFKTHLRFDSLQYSPKAKYLYIGRDPRDAFMSLDRHYELCGEAYYGAVNMTPGLVGEPLLNYAEKYGSATKFYDDWISKGSETMPGESDGYPWWSIFDHGRTWWEYRHLPNIKFIHYNDMLTDLPAVIREIAAFVDIPILEEHFAETVRLNTFDVMKENAATNPILTIHNQLFNGGATAFMHKGSNGRWRGVLSEEQLAKYEQVKEAKFTPECAAWFEKGKQSGVNPSSVQL